MTMKNKYPLLLILELIVKLHRAKYFTKLEVLTMFASKKVMNGRLHSEQTTDCLNCLLYSSVL